MAIEIGDIITISFTERCDGRVCATNIEEIARDNDLYNDKDKYIPAVISVGRDTLAKGLQNELIGKEVGAKGTVAVSAEDAYGERDSEKVHSIDKKALSKDVTIGSYIRHPEYGDGIVANKIGQRFIVDFNNPLAGQDLEYDYEIHEIITDPAEQLTRMLNRLVIGGKFDVSFENGKGIIATKISVVHMDQWTQIKPALIWQLFGRFLSLETLEFREEYENIFNMKPVEALIDEAAATELALEEELENQQEEQLENQQEEELENQQEDQEE